MRVLVVDDEKSIRDTISAFLLREGHQVWTAENGLVALNILSAQKIDIVISDIVMPKISGVSLLREIHDKFPDIIVILITGEPTIETASEAVRSGAFDYIPKPFTKDSIFHVVAKAVKVKELASEKQRLEDENKEYQIHLEELVETRTKALVESEKKFRAIFEKAGIGVVRTDLHGKILETNPAFQKMLNFTAEELAGKTIKEFTHKDDWDNEVLIVSETIKGTREIHRAEKRYIKKDQGILWGNLTVSVVRDQYDKPTFLIGMVEDITDRKIAEERLQFDALHDALTCLPNRTLFMDHLNLAIGRVKRNKDNMFAVLFLDLDDFKKINDSFGHHIGDELLLQVSIRISEHVRLDDTISRLGGDEFALLLESVEDHQSAIVVAKRILESVSQPYELSELKVHLTASLGISFSNSLMQNAQEYLRDADTAMYQAKRSGKNRYTIFDKSMHDYVVRRLTLEEELRRSVNNKDFILYYQPIINIISGELYGFEALVRWAHPQEGIINPGAFIKIAEETGLIIPIGEWVMQEACRQVFMWQQLFSKNISIHVNLSVKQFSDPELKDRLNEILDNSGLPPNSLFLEITESLLLEYGPDTIDSISKFKERGIKISIDDFGTGYSSLSYLHKLPIDSLKLDSSFVINMTQKEENLEIIRAVRAIGRSFNMELIAEGVETKEQAMLLRAMEYDFAQGFYFSKPLSAEEILPLLKNNRKWI